ncbi:site-specific tyrosine recombinase/integron integrase [Ekhidna sp. To15]|uniref:site-specific tyrosine recombinase/integron integrase n=1 Tax=Ekhidna sp. To15 TaxID=3395267 RepID=UPI003F51F107
MRIPDFRMILEVKRYSSNTINTYVSQLRTLSKQIDRSIDRISEKELRDCVFHLISQRQYSRSAQKQLLGALKLYYSEIHGIDLKLDFLLPHKSSFVLPEVLSKEEVSRILSIRMNTKHRAIISLLYSAGLRIGEVINLQIKSIDSDRMKIFIKGGKGVKDRYVPLSGKQLALLRAYYREHKPKDYLFEGQNKESKYSASSANKFIKRYAIKAGIKKKVSSHIFRHSFATHLLEDGIDVRIIQKLLGHNSVKTTMLYTHVAEAKLLSIESPLDTLDF